MKLLLHLVTMNFRFPVALADHAPLAHALHLPLVHHVASAPPAHLASGVKVAATHKEPA